MEDGESEATIIVGKSAQRFGDLSEADRGDISKNLNMEFGHTTQAEPAVSAI